MCSLVIFSRCFWSQLPYVICANGYFRSQASFANFASIFRSLHSHDMFAHWFRMLLSFATSTCRFRSPLTLAFIITRDSSERYYNFAHCVRSLLPYIILARHFRSECWQGIFACYLPTLLSLAIFAFGRTQFLLPIFARRFHSQVLFATLSSYQAILARSSRTLYSISTFAPFSRSPSTPKWAPNAPHKGPQMKPIWPWTDN